jgi:putative mRNA 3-end processing factor
MNISFQYANRRKGNTSLLLRFDGLVEDQTVCLLVDAGQGVDVDALLSDDEYLTGILLTHLHYDHYTALGDALRDGAQIYASEPTAALLDDVLSVAAIHADSAVDREEILDHTVAVTEQTTIAGAIDLYPVPAGHAPGATAYYLQVEADGETETLLLTGDCTLRRAGGYPGLPLHEVDGLVLNGATGSAFEDELTEAVAKTIELASAGSTTLVTANGLTGVQFGYVLGHALEELDQQLTITITGHAATIYERLEYDVPNVRSVPTYDRTDEVLGPGGVTISGPESPTEGSSGRLYGTISDQPGAALVQLVGGDGKRVTDGQCTSVHYRLVNHPAAETLDTIVDVTDPEQILMFHQDGKELAAYREHFDRSVWAPNDSDAYRIYDERGWRTPPWVGEYTRRALVDADTGPILDTGTNSLDTPVAREPSPDLEAEGLDLDRLRERFASVGTPTYRRAGDAEAEETRDRAGDDSEPQPADTPKAANGEMEAAQSTSSHGSASQETADDPKTPTASADRGEGNETKPPQSTDGGTQSESPNTQLPLEQRLEALERRLDALEATGTSDGLEATVVELADGSRLLDPLGRLPEELDHGDTVRLQVVTDDEQGDSAN